MSIAPITPSFGFGVTPGFGINPAYGVSATPPRTDVGLAPVQRGVASFGQVLADRIAAFGPTASAPAMADAASTQLSANSASAPASFSMPSVTAANMTTGAVDATAGTGEARSGLGGFFGSKLGELSALHARSDRLAVAAATGELKDIHEYTIAANEAGLATQLAVSVRDKALQAFNDIIRMQL